LTHAGIALNSTITCSTGSPDTVIARPLNVAPETATAGVEGSVGTAEGVVDESDEIDVAGAIDEALGDVTWLDVGTVAVGVGEAAVGNVLTGGWLDEMVGPSEDVGLGASVGMGVRVKLFETGLDDDDGAGRASCHDEAVEGLDIAAMLAAGPGPSGTLLHAVSTSADVVVSRNTTADRREKDGRDTPLMSAPGAGRYLMTSISL
jgi:hypothetical protein